MDDVILITLMRRKTNMISSRQIVEIINEEIKKVDLKLVWSPPWTKDMMSEEAKLELNL